MEELQRRWLVRMEQQSLDFLQDDQAQLDFIEDYCDAQLQLPMDWGDEIDWDPPDEPPDDGPTKRRMKQVVWWLLGQAGFQILWELLTGLVPRVAICRRYDVPASLLATA